jgi:hypothetical protein
MITTSSTITVRKTIRLGVVTNYTTDNVSLFIKHDGIQKRFNATDVVNATETSIGVITFSDIPLTGDGSYSVYVTAEGDIDIDTNGVELEKLATGYIKKITNQSILDI